MKKLIPLAAAFACAVSAGVALAQTDQTTTTVTSSPESTTKTTVTKSEDANGNYTQYRKTVTSTRHFDAGDWRAPAGYSVRHYGLGDHLPADLLASSYYLNNYGNYSLVAPPEGTVWVRVGQDAFLVRNDSGEIIQADYGVFN